MSRSDNESRLPLCWTETGLDPFLFDKSFGQKRLSGVSQARRSARFLQRGGSSPLQCELRRAATDRQQGFYSTYEQTLSTKTPLRAGIP
eukprot:COSAG06_NODE_42136_length_384_cov_1.087719_1_plen_88_part_10